MVPYFTSFTYKRITKTTKSQKLQNQDISFYSKKKKEEEMFNVQFLEVKRISHLITYNEKM